MTLIDLLDDCARRGITLSVEGDKLQVRSPQGVLTPELQAELRAHKAEILGRLRRSDASLVPLSRTTRGSEPRPLSVVQQSLWFLHRMDPATLPAYNLRRAFEIEGALDVDRWRAAFRAVAARHETLRSSFDAADEHPVARIAAPLDAQLEVVELTHLDREQQNAEIAQQMEAEGRFAFDVSAAPLFHARLLKLDAERFVFLLNAHHLVADAWSAGVILRELTAIYEGRTLPARDVEYRDYVQWQRERIERGELDSQLDYWTTQLDGLPRLQLPADFAAPVRTTYDGASVAYALPAELTDALRAFSREAGVTLYSTFLAAFAAVLHRYSGQDDFPVGTSIAGRTRKEFEDVVGFFADVLVLRMNVAGAPAFRELAQRVQQVSAEAFEHQDVPFELLVKTLRPERVAGQNPLFQVLFLFLQSDPAFRELQAPSVASKFDLSLHVEDDGTAVRGLVEYKTALFQEETIRAFLDAWMELLRGAMADPARRVDELPLLSRDARHELLVTRNEVRRAELPHATLTEWFEAQAAKTPHRIAATHGSESLTYAELDEKATRLSEVLRARGVGPETRVGLLLERSLDMIVAIVGVLKAGGAYVPLDPADPQSRIDFVRNDSGLEIVVTAGLEVTSTNSPLATNARATVNGQQATQKAAAYIIYTSGSTGQPRGVVVTHENVLRLMRSTEEWFGFGEDDVWAMFHSYAFDFSVWEIWGALLYGGRVVIVPKVTSRSPEAFATLLREEGVTVLNQTPSAFRALIPVAGELPALRYVIFGGEALDLAMLAPWVERNGDDRPRLINMYGITETTVHVTWRRITRADIDANRGSSIGTRIPDLTLYILDEQLEPVPQGVAGQLHVGGAGLARGYHGRAALTAERFVADPFSDVPGARLYRTGDLARWRSATDIEYLGRRDEQLKIRGFRIEPGEIESVLRTHAGVKECVVIAREDTPGQKRLVAYYIPADAALDAAELRALCEKALPAHMVPAGYVAVDAWPRTRNDKLDRAMLPLPDLERASAKRTYAAPRNARERTLAAIWSRVLGVPNVGVDDDFFALGGDSMLSLEVLSQMRKEGLQSSVAQLYQHHRISELAEVVETLTHADAATAPFSLVNEEDRARLPQGLTDAYPLSQLQAGMLYEEQLHQHDALYHDIFSFHLRMPLDEASWMRVLQAEVDRHELLRTSFDLTHFSEPLQLVHAAAAANCVFEDLSPLDADAQERRIAALIDAERDQPFDYAAPPLLRFYLLRRGGDGTQVVFGFHHAILDGWSVALLFSRIVASYLGELKLRPAAAPEALPAVRYADFVALERQALASGEAFWKNELAQLPVTRIPRREDAAGGPRRLARMPVVLPEAVSAGLERTARLAGVPLKTVVLAAHLRVLGALTGQQEVVSGVVTNGRPERPGADRVAGLFLNTLPLRVDLGSGTFLELVQRTFEAERRLLAHRNFPMAAVKQLAGGRPLFDAAFNFIHFHVYQEVLQTEGVELLDYAVWEQTDLPFLPQFSVHPGSSRVELLLVHDGATFTSAQMESIAGAYVRCLTGLAEHPKSAFREQTLFEDERALLESWSGGTSVVESPDAIHRWFEAQVARTPESEAVRFEGEAWTYRELDARANRLAQYLRARGVQRETLVGLCVERSLDLVAGILGILKAGGAYVPLDPAYPADRLRFTIEDSGVPLVVTHSAHEALLAGVPLVLLDRDADAIAAQPDTAPEGEVRREQAAYVIYTSGSTGHPKGVVVTHGNVTRLMAATESLYDFSPSDVWTLFHSYAFDFSVWELWGALLYGGRVVVVPYVTSRSPEQFHRLLVDEGVTVLNQTPSAFYQLLDHPAPPSLRYVIFGGEALDLGRLRGWLDRHGDEHPQLVNMYGITETTVHVTYRRIRKADVERGAGSVIGTPLPDLKAIVLDAAGDLAHIGVAGELYVGGAGVSRGYLNRDELTASRFLDTAHGRLYRTGDLVRWLPTGELEYLGRIDTQVKIRGFRIELGEIEHVLRAADAVSDTAVTMRDGRLVAYVVPRGAVTPAALREHCERQLPEYMVPAAYVTLESLPLTANGKLDRDALPDPDAEALPRTQYVAPRNEVEEQLCALWEQVLGVSPIGVRHKFFELGGHSLHATQLMARVRSRFAVHLPLSSLFEEPTVEHLAALIAAHRTKPAHESAGSAARSAPVRSKRRQVRLTDQGEVIDSGPE